MERKALFFDVDGTLIDNETKEIPASAVRAIRDIQAAGHLVLINSGRVLCILKQTMQDFGITSAVCGCGTQIVIDGETVMESRIPHDRGNEIKRNILKFGLDAVLEAQEAEYFSGPPFRYPQVMEEIVEYISSLAEAREAALTDESYDFDKFCIQIDPLFPDRKRWNEFLSTIPDIACIDRGHGFYECIQKGYDKGTAIDYLLNRFGIAYENAYVFGDSMNDLAMFTSRAGNRILLGEHDTALEPYATFMAKNVMDDGIEDAVRRLGIL